MTIKTFRDKVTAAAFLGLPVKSLAPSIRKRARSKLEQIHYALRLDDLRVPPGNMLEILAGSRAGQYSIRINQQWRICFVWQDGNAMDVEIVDYHH
ncbi:MAG: type II toxin-antitoxin system RelE/ParE family toxin [Zoogloeaceae bacterium]|jgi:proteic killer suppression protein|nr:type II toxin-antitoxin system RelE/ParE family toxin [Zoogloeaceae bacterium]